MNDSSQVSVGRMRLIIAFMAGVCATALFVYGSDQWLSARSRGEVPSLVNGSDAKRLSAHDMAQALRGGGYILYFRHPERQKWDSVIAFDVVEAATRVDASTRSWKDAVCLTPRGVEEAKMVGTVLKMAQIPVGTVVSSPICRARQMAQLGFGRVDATYHALIHTPVTNDSNAGEFKKELQKVLTTVQIKPGTNTVIAAHGHTIRIFPDMFVEGQEFLHGTPVHETGLYVLKREQPSGQLKVVYKFMSLGDLAAAGITLSASGGPAHAGKPAL